MLTMNSGITVSASEASAILFGVHWKAGVRFGYGRVMVEISSWMSAIDPVTSFSVKLS